MSTTVNLKQNVLGGSLFGVLAYTGSPGFPPQGQIKKLVGLIFCQLKIKRQGGQYRGDSCHPAGWQEWHYEWDHQGSGKSIILDKWVVVIDPDQPDRREAQYMIVTISWFIPAIYNLCALPILSIPNSRALASKPWQPGCCLLVWEVL